MSLVMRVLRTLQVLPTLTVLLSLSAYAPAAASPQLSAEVPTEGGLRISNVITRFEPKDNPIFRMVYVVVDEYEGQSAYADGGEGGGVQAERQSVCYFDSVGHRGVWVGGEFKCTLNTGPRITDNLLPSDDLSTLTVAANRKGIVLSFRLKGADDAKSEDNTGGTGIGTEKEGGGGIGTGPLADQLDKPHTLDGQIAPDLPFIAVVDSIDAYRLQFKKAGNLFAVFAPWSDPVVFAVEDMRCEVRGDFEDCWWDAPSEEDRWIEA